MGAGRPCCLCKHPNGRCLTIAASAQAAHSTQQSPVHDQRSAARRRQRSAPTARRRAASAGGVLAPQLCTLAILAHHSLRLAQRPQNGGPTPRSARGGPAPPRHAPRHLRQHRGAAGGARRQARRFRFFCAADAAAPAAAADGLPRTRRIRLAATCTTLHLASAHWFRGGLFGASDNTRPAHVAWLGRVAGADTLCAACHWRCCASLCCH